VTKRDVKKFFSRLGDGILIIGIIGLASIGFMTSIVHTIDWMEKPSKIEVLSDKVDELKEQSQAAHVHTFYGNDFVTYTVDEQKRSLTTH
jgi:hypothetical protein